MSPLAAQVDSTFEFDISDVFGARLNLLLPVTGWTLGASAYVGNSQASGLAAPISGDLTAYGIHSEYLTDRWSVRAEYAFLDADLAEQDTTYLELARRLGAHWQVGVRWEDSEAIPDFAGLLTMLPLPPGLPPSGFPPGLPPGTPILPPFVDRFFEHRDVVVGVNYWFAEAYVLKVNFHRVTGNRLAVPDSPEALQDLNRGILDDSTDLVEIGFQFSF
jgi:hypothetical protein